MPTLNKPTKPTTTAAPSHQPIIPAAATLRAKLRQLQADMDARDVDDPLARGQG